MRRLIPFAFMAVLMIMAGPLQAQDVSGVWTLSYSQMGRQGGAPRDVSMDVTLKQDGATVTGTALMPMGGRGGGGLRRYASPIGGGGRPSRYRLPSAGMRRRPGRKTSSTGGGYGGLSRAVSPSRLSAILGSKVTNEAAETLSGLHSLLNIDHRAGTQFAEC